MTLLLRGQFALSSEMGRGQCVGYTNRDDFFVGRRYQADIGHMNSQNEGESDSENGEKIKSKSGIRNPVGRDILMNAASSSLPILNPLLNHPQPWTTMNKPPLHEFNYNLFLKALGIGSSFTWPEVLPVSCSLGSPLHYARQMATLPNQGNEKLSSSVDFIWRLIGLWGVLLMNWIVTGFAMPSYVRELDWTVCWCFDSGCDAAKRRRGGASLSSGSLLFFKCGDGFFYDPELMPGEWPFLLFLGYIICRLAHVLRYRVGRST